MRFEKDPGGNEAINHAIERLLLATFETPFEAELVRKLRERDALVREQLYWDSETLVGHIAYSRVRVETSSQPTSIWGLGPMSITPAYQNRGLGKAFLEESLAALTLSGPGAIVLLGHIGFYTKARFAPALNFGLSFGVEGVPEEAFMAIELENGCLQGSSGRILYEPEFYPGA